MQFATFWAAFYNPLFAELLLMTLKPFTNQDNTFACCSHQRVAGNSFSAGVYLHFGLGQWFPDTLREWGAEHSITVYVFHYLNREGPGRNWPLTIEKEAMGTVSDDYNYFSQ